MFSNSHFYYLCAVLPRLFPRLFALAHPIEEKNAASIPGHKHCESLLAGLHQDIEVKVYNFHTFHCVNVRPKSQCLESGTLSNHPAALDCLKTPPFDCVCESARSVRGVTTQVKLSTNSH